MENKEIKSKYKAQIKHRKNNYKQFNIDFRFDTFEQFLSVCKKNNTTPTNAIKKFVDEYIKNNL